jgi:hypothetical protein
MVYNEYAVPSMTSGAIQWEEPQWPVMSELGEAAANRDRPKSATLQVH